MRKIAFCLFMVFCFVFPLFIAGCASTQTQESTGEFVDDSVITAKIKAEIAGDKLISLYQISVETYKGVVQLSGFVNTQEQVDEAIGIAEKVPGVKKVKNSLLIKPQ
ncbi:BON domain-containing protein [bacterium]|nr:MAG: BON domain-containing protein [bacterium]